MAHDRTGPPSRSPSGVNNVAPGYPLEDLPFPDPTLQCTFIDDFDGRIPLTSWTITSVGALATCAFQDAENGVLQVTTSTGASAAAYFEWAAGETFTLRAGKALHFKARLKVTLPSLAAFFVGLHNTDTSPLDATHRAVFLSPAASTSVQMVVDDNSTETANTLSQTIDADDYMELTFSYDGGSKFSVWQDDAKVGELTISDLPASEPLAVGFGIISTSGAATMNIDLLMVSKDR